uniref:Uncharacterized protein n=1 Tax=Magallana gigas TaxID=29159 RepID=K1QN56_MAGGI
MVKTLCEPPKEFPRSKSPPCRHPSSPNSGEWSGDFSFVEFKQELFRPETQASLELFGTKALAGGGGLAVFYLLQLSLEVADFWLI